MAYCVAMATVRSRRHEYSEATRQALVDSAVELFTKHGYAGTSLDEIARKARVTKGALYHHFAGKHALFEAAFDAVETAAMAKFADALASASRPWQMVQSGLQVYLQVCLEPAFQRIVVHEAPVVMGWERWRECEEQYSFGIVRSSLQLLLDSGEIEPLPAEELARIVFGALTAGAMVIAGAENQKRASADVAKVIERVLLGLRRQPEPEPAADPERPAEVRKLRRRR
jgi:AcrR family transcriptional regulator